MKFTYTYKEKDLGTILQVWSKQTCYSQWRTGLSGALAGALCELAALGNSRSSSTKNHRTVRWALGATTDSANGRLRDCARSLKRQRLEDIMQRQVAPDCPVCKWTVRCTTRTDDFNGQQLQNLMVSWRDTHRTVNSGVFGVPIDRIVSQQLE
jgi:hypothetical protein